MCTVVESDLGSLLDGRADDLAVSLARLVQPDGTILDPELALAAPTDHYAQLSVVLMLYMRAPHDSRARVVLEAWLALPPERRGHAPFNRFLLLLLAESTQGHHGTAIHASMAESGLLLCETATAYPSNNWALLAQLCRIIEARTMRNRARAVEALLKMLDRWTTQAGGFIDFPSRGQKSVGSTPMAYHHKALFVATVATLYSDTPQLMRHVRRMLDWVLLSWDGRNHVGGFGRSTHSLFGDACLVSSLVLLGYGQSKCDSVVTRIMGGVLARWASQRRQDGLIALNAAATIKDMAGYDNYMYLSVYNAWAAALVLWSRSISSGKSVPMLLAGVAIKKNVMHDEDAGLLRIETGENDVFLISTYGQPPQAFSRDEVELRYAGGMPFHVSRVDGVICPASSRVSAHSLLNQPVQAGWTPVFLINGDLFGLTEFDTVRIDETNSLVSVTLTGKPIRLLRAQARTLWGRVRASIDWRVFRGGLGRREVFSRARAEKIDCRLVLSVSKVAAEITHELYILNHDQDQVSYLNPAGHARVKMASPVVLEMHQSDWVEESTENSIKSGSQELLEAPIESTVSGATGYALGRRTIGGRGYHHRVTLRW